MTPEGKASDQVRLRASEWGIRLFRNNNGVLPNPENNRPVRFGLGNESKEINKQYKSGDFVGITPVVITPEMVGKTVGVFTNIEVKPEGFKIKERYNERSREFAQNNFNRLVQKIGGLAGFARNQFDVDNLIQQFIERLKQ